MAIYDTRVPVTGRPLDHVELGAGLGADLDHRLLGDVAGRRVLVLGCGAGHDAVGLTQRGAAVTAVDPDPAQVAATRLLATREAITVGVRQAELAELAFLPADRMDLVVSVGALSFVDDLDHVFRQVHRVMKPGARFVISVPHPALLSTDPVNPHRTTRRWDDPEPVWERCVHRAEDIVTALHRANLGIDMLLERNGPGPELVPATLIARGEKFRS
jgi:SAM-dependent methyltransferase